MEIFATNSLASGFSQFSNSVKTKTASLYTYVKANSYDKMTPQQRIITGIVLALLAAISAFYIIKRVWQSKASVQETNPIPGITVTPEGSPAKGAPPTPVVTSASKNEEKLATPPQQISAQSTPAAPSSTATVSKTASPLVATLPTVNANPQTPVPQNTSTTTPAIAQTSPIVPQAAPQSSVPIVAGPTPPTAVSAPANQSQTQTLTPLKHPTIKKLQDEDKALLMSPKSPKPTAFINSTNSPFDSDKEKPATDLPVKTPQGSDASKEPIITTPGGHALNPIDLMDGEHQVKFADGYELNGTFKNGLLTGQGKVVDPILCRVISGNFENGLLNGVGTITYYTKFTINEFKVKEFKDEDCIRVEEGEFIDGILHGKGKVFLSSGATQEGEFKWSRLNGKGSITYPNNGGYKKGLFLEGDLHGKGEQKIGKKEKEAGYFIYGEYQSKKSWSLFG